MYLELAVTRQSIKDSPNSRYDFLPNSSERQPDIRTRDSHGISRPFNRNETEDKFGGTTWPGDSPITRNDVKSSGDNGWRGPGQQRDTCSLLIGPRRFYPSRGVAGGRSRRTEDDGEKAEASGRPMAPVRGKYVFFLTGPPKDNNRNSAVPCPLRPWCSFPFTPRPGTKRRAPKRLFFAAGLTFNIGPDEPALASPFLRPVDLLNDKA